MPSRVNLTETRIDDWDPKHSEPFSLALMADVLGVEKFAQTLTLDDIRFLFAD